MDGHEIPEQDHRADGETGPTAARPLPNPPRPKDGSTRSGALVEVRWFEPALIAGALLLALLALAVGYWLGRSDDEPRTLAPAAAAASSEDDSTEADSGLDDPAQSTPPTTIIVQTSTTVAVPVTVAPAPDAADDATPDIDDPDATDSAGSTESKPAESKAVVLKGKIYLEGAVPSQEAADEIVELAAAILGADNVINNYVVDPEAGDPNLGNIRVADSVLFESGSAVIAPEFEPLLNQAVALMTIRPSVTMKVIGHTDDIGSIKLNKKLSKQRAQAVVDFIVDKGIDPGRFDAVGRGERRPIADNTTDDGRRANRRIQVQLKNLLAD